ncbi:MAG: class I SAM-dependent methyltransferase [Candidatus Heimdallarchaeota archaeon]|nr:class I SAM-dependent methyltransferase [Candidatus Heimdallarchaeota archaeon]MCG3256388.1 class I SAM-dependent methyltransferase [Candidatus Heimdallarchaeota archaeon]MCK4611454.1 class I SAM-dependent methyltransferase [Candidatus Heimdallarchaeota archaeon]
MDEIADYLANHLLELGIKENMSVLDFGCGSGNYTIPVAKIIGSDGRVIAIDEDQVKLEQLIVNAKEAKVEKRIEIMKSDGQLEISLKSKSIDLVMLYNVTCCIIGKNNYPEFQKLIKEIHGITKENGKFIIGIKEGKTMLNRIEKAISLMKRQFP